ncbi:MAG TPA: hypothetical protein VH593_26960 [Ktedonobacteraceae bacterium]
MRARPPLSLVPLGNSAVAPTAAAVSPTERHPKGLAAPCIPNFGAIVDIRTASLRFLW